MTDTENYLWRLVMPNDGAPIQLEVNTFLEETMAPQEYIAYIGEALTEIGTRFLLSIIHEGFNVTDSSEDEQELQPSEEVSFE